MQVMFSRQPPVAVLFTSFSNRTDKLFIYTQVIRNWASFLPSIQPVLFTTFESGPVIQIAKKYGWHVYPAPATNKYRIPILKNMYLAAIQHIKATFYGYANGDIVFGLGLRQTLLKIKENDDKLHTSLIFGIRRNYNLTNETDYNANPIWPPRSVANLVYLNSLKLFRFDAFDYFFLPRTYPFRQMKPLVIARGGFDNYFVALTNILQLNSIHATFTVNAIHLTDQDGIYSHLQIKDPEDKWYNRKMLGKSFNYKRGYASTATFATARDPFGDIYIQNHKSNNDGDIWWHLYLTYCIWNIVLAQLALRSSSLHQTVQ